jgi:hypothetical protein
VLIDNEWLGPDGAGSLPLLAYSRNADAMVSVGNVDAMVDLPAMGKVIGGTVMRDFAGQLDRSVQLPLRFVPNGISQAGLTCLRTEEC